MSYQYKQPKEQIRAHVKETTADILRDLATATGRGRGDLLEEMINDHPLYKKALVIRKELEEENIEKLRKELGIK